MALFSLSDRDWGALLGISLGLFVTLTYIVFANMGQTGRASGVTVIMADVDDANMEQATAFIEWAQEQRLKVNLAIIPGKISDANLARLLNQRYVELGIHSWSHTPFRYLLSVPGGARRDMAQCLDRVPSAQFVLAPQGYFNHFATQEATELELQPVYQFGTVVTKIGVAGDPTNLWGAVQQNRLLDVDYAKASTLNISQVIIIHPIQGQLELAQAWLIDKQPEAFYVSESYTRGPPLAVSVVLYIGLPSAILLAGYFASESNRVRARYMAGGLLVLVGGYILIPSPDDIIFPNGPMALMISQSTGIGMSLGFFVSYLIGGLFVVLGLYFVGRGRQLLGALKSGKSRKELGDFAKFV